MAEDYSKKSVKSKKSKSKVQRPMEEEEETEEPIENYDDEFMPTQKAPKKMVSLPSKLPPRPPQKKDGRGGERKYHSEQAPPTYQLENFTNELELAHEALLGLETDYHSKNASDSSMPQEMDDDQMLLQQVQRFVPSPPSYEMKSVRPHPSSKRAPKPQQYQTKISSQTFQQQLEGGNFRSPLPPITTTENINEIFQTKLQSSSIKAFRDYFVENAKTTCIVKCDANTILTDAHFFELSQLEWPYLRTISIRACPNVSLFVKSYIQTICDKNKGQPINVDLEWNYHSPQTMLNQSQSITETLMTLETLFGKGAKRTVSKSLIYHANSKTNTLLTSSQTILNQFRKSKDTSSLLLDYVSTMHNDCQMVFLECTHSILFKELWKSFHPQMLYLVISSVDDLLKCFFSSDSAVSYSILHDQELRLIVNKTEDSGSFLSTLLSQLTQISASARELYAKCLADTNTSLSDNDDFRRNHHLTSLLHVQTKCDILQKKLTKDHFLIWNSEDSSTLSSSMLKDAVKYSKTTYSLSGLPADIEGGNNVLETDVSVMKLAQEIGKKAAEQGSDAIGQASTKTAQAYFEHKLFHDRVLDLQSASNGKSYLISDIEWFCRTVNQLFASVTHPHRKTELLINQFKQTIGANVQIISKRDLKKIKATPEETDFLYWLLDTWNIGYSVPIGDHVDNHLYVLFNSTSPEPPVPLNTVWSKSWRDSDFQSEIDFHLLHPCDPSILFQLYKLFPSQKILLACRDFLLVRDGAVEILVECQHPNSQSTDITMTCRALNLLAPKTETDNTNALLKESFRYLVRVYYMIIWAFLFKNDYAFKIERTDPDATNSSEEINGNAFMASQWKHLALYHYSPAPTLTSGCSVCGLPPAANKSLYDACTILSPASHTTQTNHDSPSGTNAIEDQSSSFIYELGKNAFSYTGKHSLRPDGYNSFEVIFLRKDTYAPLPPSSIFSSLKIGCLMNNFLIVPDEEILFDYGLQVKAPAKRRNFRKTQTDSNPASYLDEIRNFGGVEGLIRTKNQTAESSISQEIYSGLQLRIDILYSHKPNTFEFVYSVNGRPWSRQTVKRKSTQTIFQPIVRSKRTDYSDETILLVVQHHRSLLDNALIENLPLTHLKKPWKVGMRLEAKDRKNPSILAIANVVEVYEDNRVRINFDGWTSTFDYTVETDNSDLHPCGYWEYVQRVLYKNVNSNRISPHFTFSRYDKPKSYDRGFSWRNYLVEKDIEPVPFECFTYIQTEGMPADFFPHGISKAAFSRLSCRHYFNVRVKYHKLTTFIQEEIVAKLLCVHSLEGPSPTLTAASWPGAVLLPTPIDMSMLSYPCLKQYQNLAEIVLHLTCNHRETAPWDSSTIVSGAHLLDTGGIQTAKKNLPMSALTLCMLTATDLSRNQKHPIAPCTSKLVSNQPASVDQRLMDFFIRRWLDLSAYITCFHSTDFYSRHVTLHAPGIPVDALYATYSDQDLYVTLEKNLDSINLSGFDPADERQENPFGYHGECFYCSLLRKDNSTRRSNLSFEKRLEMIGGYAPSIFFLEIHEQDKVPTGNRVVLDDKFFTRFNGLELIDIKNVTIDRFQLSAKNSDALTHLTYLSLENNDLTTINADFQHVNRLSYLKLTRNPFESLPLSIFSSKSLQSVEFSELGRLLELDPNTRFSSELKTLTMTESVLTTLPQSLGVDARTKLTKLTLSGASWWRPDGMSVNEVVKYESFEKKFVSFLDNQELSAIYQLYDEDTNGILSFSEINLMNAHIYRFIPRLRSTNSRIPNSGRSSVEPGTTNEQDLLKQESFSLDPSGIPSAIFSLVNLTELTLDYQGIRVVSDAIKNLRSLLTLNLNYCIELETISAEVGFLPLKELNLTGCISLKTPPMEIIRRGHQQTMAFLQRLVSGSTACKRTKLMLVGLGGAGKTSLVRAFLRSHSNTPPTVTDGIDILKWKVPLGGADDFLEFSVWDFAGQSVYYHTHQFFLAKKAVYVLAWNIRLGAEHAGLDFWLSSICCHAPNAPIFVVGTHSDQVSRIDLRQDDFKRRYPQIAGFFNVSTYTGDHVDELIENIIKTTLALPYMDELIPKAWLSFEHLIGECKQDILRYPEVEEIAHNAGIFEASEVLQAVQFLHDLGSLQYFSSEHLKNYVVINPQWIVNVMACIVSIKDSPVQDGRLLHSDIGVIWGGYDTALHPWILKLTEAFDLTFPVPDQNMNLVPCLLPEDEPEYTWAEISSDSDDKELKVAYTFNYLPAGLFNRAQVRLFQFSDKSTIWRYGSLLVKNNHRAVIIRTDDRHIVIKIQGIRPDNILFLIHEVFEGLVNESFFGVTYDIAFPCPDCLESRTSEPWQFSSSLINRAIELKSPSIQCHRFFHVASVTDLQALIPPDSKSNYDLHLEYSVRDLKSYRQNVAVDIVYIYPPEHIPTPKEIETKVDPRQVKDDLTKRGLKVWTPETMDGFKIENHYLVIKAAGVVVFGISTELIENPENRQLLMAFETIKDILRKPIVPILFGTTMKWKESEIGVALSDALYVNMQNPKRYSNRMKELLDLVEQSMGGDKQNQHLRDQPTDVFVSYCWLNSHDAANKGTKTTDASLGWGDPRSMKDYLESRGLSVWMDITRLGKSGVIQDIVHGLKNTKVVVACVSNEYTQSEICRNEFLFAKNTLRLPVILAIFGNGDEWRMTEVGMCGLTCSQVNFQFENPTAFEDIYSSIRNRLPKRPSSAKETAPNAVAKPGAEEKTTAAYQELFELTQRKFLRLTSGFAETMTTRPYPRLFVLDLMNAKEKSAQELARIEVVASMSEKPQESTGDNERDLEAERERDEELRRDQEKTDATSADGEVKEDVKAKTKPLCIRALCENEENWHAAGQPFEITDKIVVQNGASFLSRIMLLLKQSDLSLNIVTSDDGEAELEKLAEMTKTAQLEAKDSYAYLRRWVMDNDGEEKYCGLKQCLMPSGKVLWLCEEHQRQPRVVLVTGSVGGGYARPQVEEQSEIIKALAKLNERIANNELPVPSISTFQTGTVRRSSSDKSGPSRRQVSRYSKRDSLTVKPENQNIRKIVEVDQETNADVRDNHDHTPKREDEIITDSGDCSIM